MLSSLPLQHRPIVQGAVLPSDLQLHFAAAFQCQRHKFAPICSLRKIWLFDPHFTATLPALDEPLIGALSGFRPTYVVTSRGLKWSLQVHVMKTFPGQIRSDYTSRSAHA